MSRIVLVVPISVLCCLLVSVFPQSEQTTALAGYSDTKLYSKNNTNSSAILDDADENALGFAQGIMRCWVCASCPEVRNGQKNINATAPRWCPSSVDLNASHMCVTYSIEKSFWTFAWLTDMVTDLTKKARRKRKWYRAGTGPQRNQMPLQQQRAKGIGRQVGEQANTGSTWIKRIYTYRGCTVYEGFCTDIRKRNYGANWLNHCYECKGDMCNDVRLLIAFPRLVAMAMAIYFLRLF